MEQLAKSVKAASFALQTLKTTEKNEILQSIHTEMQSRKEEILRQNELDLEVFYG
jgi:gamma-glutamyl phosphate reductase